MWGVVAGVWVSTEHGCGLCDGRGIVFRKKTKQALAAVRRLFQEGLLKKEQKRKLIYSVIHSTSQEEVSPV